MQIQITPTDDFDAALKMLHSVGGGTLTLLPGNYNTRGCWAFPGWGYALNDIMIVGLTDDDGVRPVIRLFSPEMKPGGVFRPQKDVNILQLGARCSLRDLVFDGTLAEFPDYCVGGVRFAGPYTVSNCHFKGLRGNKATSMEVFVVSSQGNTGGSLVFRVTAADCKPNSYVSGIYLGGTIHTTEPSLVSECDMDMGGDNMFCYSATYSVRFSECKGKGAEAFFHNDYGETMNCAMYKCHGSASEAAVRLIATEAQCRELYLENCTIAAQRALVLWQASPAPMTGHFIAKDCTFVTAKWAACVVAQFTSAAFINCLFEDTVEVQHRRANPKPAFIFNREKPVKRPVIKFVDTGV